MLLVVRPAPSRSSREKRRFQTRARLAPLRRPIALFRALRRWPSWPWCTAPARPAPRSRRSGTSRRRMGGAAVGGVRWRCVLLLWRSRNECRYKAFELDPLSPTVGDFVRWVRCLAREWKGCGFHVFWREPWSNEGVCLARALHLKSFEQLSSLQPFHTSDRLLWSLA